VLKIGVAAMVLVVILALSRSVSWARLMTVIAAAHPGLLMLATLSTLCCTAIKGVRFWVLLRYHGRPMLSDVVQATFAGIGLNAVLVANAGEVARVTLLARSTRLPAMAIIGTLAVDKVAEIGAFLCVILLTFGLLPQQALAFPKSTALIGLTLACVAGVALLLTSRVVERVRASVVAARGQLRSKAFGAAFLLALSSWGGQVITYAVAALAVNVLVPLAATVAALVLVNLGGVIRSTPGNVGVFQVMYALGVASFGVGRTEAIAVAILIQAIQLLSAVGAGALCVPLMVGRSAPGS